MPVPINDRWGHEEESAGESPRLTIEGAAGGVQSGDRA